MTETPILFTGEMVKAIIAGRKTQTRRIVKTVPSCHDPEREVPTVRIRRGPQMGSYTVLDDMMGPSWSPAASDPLEPYPWHDRLSPYGGIGDRLWVKETWAVLTGNGVRVVYRADGEDPRTGPCSEEQRKADPMRWRPSIFMKRQDSRLTLEVTSVRVERIQDISERDACTEVGGNPMLRWCYRPKFQALWDSINSKRAPWAANPWVWAISFRRVEGT